MNWSTKVKRVTRYEVVAWSNADQRVTDRVPVADRGDGLEMVAQIKSEDPDLDAWVCSSYRKGEVPRGRHRAKTVAELMELDREHPDNWRRE